VIHEDGNISQFGNTHRFLFRSVRHLVGEDYHRIHMLKFCTDVHLRPVKDPQDNTGSFRFFTVVSFQSVHPAYQCDAHQNPSTKIMIFIFSLPCKKNRHTVESSNVFDINFHLQDCQEKNCPGKCVAGRAKVSYLSSSFPHVGANKAQFR
jgi:hypothetical protein